MDRVVPHNVPLSLLLAVGLGLRAGLIQYAHWQDSTMDVKYTDVDYSVFLEGAKAVVERGSPYDDANPLGYKYTPIIAWLLTPSVVWSVDFGKWLFVGFDLLAAVLIWKIATKLGYHRRHVWMATALWLFNPLTLVVSSRGNAESIQSCLVLATLYTVVFGGHPVVVGLVHGLAVHFKVYPLIYIPSVFLHFAETPQHRRAIWVAFLRFRPASFVRLSLGNRRGVVYAVSLAAMFGLLLAVGYRMYGRPFVYHTYLHHFQRRDPQHNFSPYFYLFHKSQGRWWEPLVASLAFVPQLFGVLYATDAFPDDLPVAWFFATAYFVSSNKVCTSQYFLWYLTLLPFLIGRIRISWLRCCVLIGCWFAAQGVWLGLAYLLEFKRLHIRESVWSASLMFLGVNLWILFQLRINYVGRGDGQKQIHDSNSDAREKFD